MKLNFSASDENACQGLDNPIKAVAFQPLPFTPMQKDAEPSQATRMDRRSFLKSAAAGTAAFATGVSLLSWGRPLQGGGPAERRSGGRRESGKRIGKRPSGNLAHSPTVRIPGQHQAGGPEMDGGNWN